MTHGITKSKYTQYRSCAKALWLNVYKSAAAVIDDSTMARFATGNEVGDLAMGLLGPFEEMTVTKGDGCLDYGKMVEKTLDAVSRGVENICEAAFSHHGNYCAVDILHKTAGGYEIYEVKSTTKPDKEIYAWDVAFQKYILTSCGINVTGTFLVYINNKYVRHGDIEIKKLFSIKDISEAVDAEYPSVAENVRQARRVLEGEEPAKAISADCNSPYSCPFWQYCTKHIPSPSVFDLYQMNIGKKIELFNKGVVTYEDVKDMSLTKTQRMQVDSYLGGVEKVVDNKGIRDFLGKLTYPLYFLDFETIQPVVPLYDGTHPYQQITTQYSLHYQLSEGGELLHKEYLAPSNGNPLRPLAERLCEDIPKDACVVAYNKKFECGCIKELAELFDDLSDHLTAIKDNIVDLLVPFQGGSYYVPAMGGSFSIKSVLPALFPNDPELDYHSLDGLCQNGGDAMNLFPALKDMEPAEEKKARQALLDYCRLDTLAMVKVLQKLQEAVK